MVVVVGGGWEYNYRVSTGVGAGIRTAVRRAVQRANICGYEVGLS